MNMGMTLNSQSNFGGSSDTLNAQHHLSVSQSQVFNQTQRIDSCMLSGQPVRDSTNGDTFYYYQSYASSRKASAQCLT